MFFGLEQEDGSVITPVAMAHPLQPLRKTSRNKHWNRGLDDVSPSNDFGSGPYTHFIIMYITSILAAFQVFEISSF